MSLFSQEALNLVYGEPQGAAPSNVQSFVDRVAPLAQTVGERLNVDPAILIGQWGLETGWGKSVVPGTNNLGNIKDFSGRGPMATDLRIILAALRVASILFVRVTTMGFCPPALPATFWYSR